MSPNKNWRRLVRMCHEAAASGTAVVAFAVALAAAWSAALILGLGPNPGPPQLSGPPDVDATWPAA